MIRKSPRGISTNKLVFSSHMGTSDQIFPSILDLYVKKGSKVADVTYGKGVFWKSVKADAYQTFFSDLKTGTDSRKLPYEDNSLDCVVFDPPYMHTPGGNAHTEHQNFEEYYRNNVTISNKKYHEAVLDLYFESGKEAKRVLKPKGIYIVKCADEVCANRQRLTHVEVINELTNQGFIPEDIFILTRTSKPGVSRMIVQLHARKNHSYFIIMRKKVPIPKHD